MSEFRVEVSQVNSVRKHPNADTLSIADVNGYPVIFRTGDFSEGELAVYVPVDSIVPDLPQWAFLAGHRRIKAKKLRGVFSMGLLSKASPEWALGQNVQAELGIEKWEPESKLMMNTENEVDPGFLPVLTDIEGLRRNKTVLVPGEEVVITEKIHGANARFVYRDGALWVGSHKNIKRRDENNMWWQLAIALGLEERLGQYIHRGRSEDLRIRTDIFQEIFYEPTARHRSRESQRHRIAASRPTIYRALEMERSLWLRAP